MSQSSTRDCNNLKIRLHELDFVAQDFAHIFLLKPVVRLYFRLLLFEARIFYTIQSQSQDKINIELLEGHSQI